MSANTRKATDLDKLIGRRLREVRIARGVTLENLSKESGVSYQQIQKYERGVNRIPASRLAYFSSVLDAPINVIFSGIVPQSPGADELLCKRPSEVLAVKALRRLPREERSALSWVLNMIAEKQSAR